MDRDDIDSLRLDADSLSAELRTLSAEGRSALTTLSEEAARAKSTLTETATLTRSLSGNLQTGLSKALKSALIDGKSLSSVLRSLAKDVSRSVANTAINGLTGQISGALVSGLSGAFSATPVRAFAKGGVLSGPTTFPMQGGMGLAGEAGPEAILPLRRGADGRLGIAAEQSATPQISVTIQTPDPERFRRSQTQIAATIARAVDRGRRNL